MNTHKLLVDDIALRNGPRGPAALGGDVLNRLRDESGIALVMALMVMFVLTIVTTTVIFYIISNQHSSQLSLTRDGSRPPGRHQQRDVRARIASAISLLGSGTTPSIRTCSAACRARPT